MNTFSHYFFIWKKSENHKDKVALSFLLSLCLHLVLILLLCVKIFSFSKVFSLPPKEIPPPPEVIFDFSPPVTPPSTIQTAAEHPLEKPPEHPVFESHENTAAASELPASDSGPLPTQEGRQSEGVELKTAEVLGRKNTDSAASTEVLPKATPSSTPLSATTTPLAEKENSSDHPIMGTLSSAAKAESEASGAHPSVIHGAISNKGKSSVAAEATPLGRYKKNLADAISSHWYYAIDQRMELLSYGTATVMFYVTQQGKIENLRVTSNSSNQTFADCCITSITGAKLPSIPPEIAQTLNHGRLEIEYRFTIYP